jgi:hypothetical protein
MVSVDSVASSELLRKGSEMSSVDSRIDAPYLLANKRTTKEGEITESKAQFLGTVSAMSSVSSTSNLDWALIQINQVDMLFSVLEDSEFPFVQSVLSSVPTRTAVLVKTSSSGLTRGFITANSTFMQLPNYIPFQEMWTVYLEGPLGEHPQPKVP